MLKKLPCLIGWRKFGWKQPRATAAPAVAWRGAAAENEKDHNITKLEELEPCTQPPALLLLFVIYSNVRFNLYIRRTSQKGYSSCIETKTLKRPVNSPPCDLALNRSDSTHQLNRLEP